MCQQAFIKRILCVLFMLINGFIYCQPSSIDSINNLLFSKTNDKAIIQVIEKISNELNDSSFNCLDDQLYANTHKMNNIEDEIQLAKYYYFLGYKSFLDNDDIEAIKYFLTSLNFTKNSDFPYLNFRLYQRLANSYARIGFFTKTNSLYPKIMVFYEKAETIIETIPGSEEELFSLYTSIAHSYHGFNNVDESEKYYLKAEKIAGQIGCDESIIKSLMNRGNMYFKHGQLDKGEKITLKALQYADSIDYELGKTYCLINLCQIMQRKQDFERALDYALQTYHEASKSNFKYMLFRANQEQATIYLNQGKLYKASAYFEKSLNNLNPSKDQYYIKSILKELSNVYLAQRQFDKASRYQDRYIQLNDSLNLIDYKKGIDLAESLHDQELNLFNNKMLDKENKLKNADLNQARTVGFGAIIVIILLAILVLIQIRTKNIYRKQSEFIKVQNDIITEQNHEITLHNKKLNNYKINLELLVDERTKELKEALKKAKDSIDFKDAFLKNISHEIRTPLNAIVGFSHLVERQEADKVKSSLSIIKQNSYDLLNTVEKILEVAGIETAVQELNIEAISSTELNNIIRTELQQYAKEVIGAAVLLSFDFANSRKSFRIDIKKLVRVLTHGLDNALKFTKEGRVVVRSFINSETIEFNISDTGVGIAEKELSTIFDDFRKGERSKILFRGVGVGLTIVNKLVLVMNGVVNIKSEVGKGTVLSITIPFSD